MNARHSLAAVLLAIAIVPTPAFADVSDADRATARALTLEGYESLDRKDFATAADRFRRADALFHVPTVTLGLAHAEVGQGKLVSALATCSRIVREGVGPNAPPAFVKAVEDARREIDALTPRIPNVIITVQGPAGAAVTNQRRRRAGGRAGREAPGGSGRARNPRRRARLRGQGGARDHPRGEGGERHPRALAREGGPRPGRARGPAAPAASAADRRAASGTASASAVPHAEVRRHRRARRGRRRPPRRRNHRGGSRSRSTAIWSRSAPAATARRARRRASAPRPAPTARSGPPPRAGSSRAARSWPRAPSCSRPRRA